MSKIKTFCSLLKSDRKGIVCAFLRRLLECKISYYIPDKLYISLMFYSFKRRFPNIKNPKTFDEKLQWLKLYNRKPEYTLMVDKYAVKDIVAKKIGEQYLIPTLGIWENVDDINFDSLPNRFVLKCTHDSGGVILCKDKRSFDIESAKEKLSFLLKLNYFDFGREWPYKNVKPRIIAEQYMEDSSSQELRDYKFYTFNGVPKFLLLATNRQSSEKKLSFDYYDMDFKHLPLTNFWHPNNQDCIPEKPTQFETMKKLASILAEGIPHVRIDFYEVDGKIYFGEMTFFDMSGFLKLEPQAWETEWGEMISLPPRNKC